jgi:hypothetical protein
MLTIVEPYNFTAIFEQGNNFYVLNRLFILPGLVKNNYNQKTPIFIRVFKNYCLITFN